jgi:hypothetical protein
MTATGTAVRHRPARVVPAAPLTVARLLRLELRRNIMPWILPLIAALFWFDSYRPSTGQPSLWALRTFWNMGQGHTIIDFGPFAAGAAAWIGSRDGRRGMADLVTAVARPRWAAELATWAATAIWTVGAYLAFVGVMFGVYAYQGVQGSPPWWWVAVGAAAVTAFSAAGFTLGAFFRSRFAAPVAAFCGFGVMVMSSQTGFSHTSGWAQILPTNSNGNYQPISGIFYPYQPDLPIARIIFLAGIAVAALGLLGLPPRAAGPGLRRAAVVITLAGVAAAGSAVGLAANAQPGPHGMIIPALHDAASDQPIRYTPVCGQAAGVPVCVNPAYHRYLPDLTAALSPVLAELAGLPGAPVRVTQVAGTYSPGETAYAQAMTISGHPPVLDIPLDTTNLVDPADAGNQPATAAGFAQEQKLLSVHAFLGAGDQAGTQAQQAVQAALLQDAGLPFAGQPQALSVFGQASWGQATWQGLIDGPEPANGLGTPKGPVYAAAVRLAALPAAARHAWLAADLAALRAGQFTLAQLP